MTDFSQLEHDMRWECRVWWQRLNGIGNDGVENRDQADRKARAELRRVGAAANEVGDSVDLIRAYAVDRFYYLRERVAAKGARIGDENIALAAVALAHVEKDAGDAIRTAALLGEGDPRLLAEARFKRLIRTEQAAELLPQVVRAVKILGKRAPVGELGASLLLWGAKVRKRWAFDYWQKSYVPADTPDGTELQNDAA